MSNGSARRGAASLCAVLCILFLTDISAQGSPWPSDWEKAARRHGIEPGLLVGAALAASGQVAQRQTAPWPWTLAIHGKVEHYPSRERAERALRNARKSDEGLKIGLLGIPVTTLPDRAAPDLLDPRRNLDQGAALIAQGLRAHPGDRALGVGRYRGISDPEARAFGARVLELAKKVANGPLTQTLQGPIRTLSGSRPAGCVPPARRAVAAAVEAAARRHGVDPSFALAIAQRESALRQSAVSPKGARGVMQLMPGTARRYGADPRKLDQNIDAGVRYLRDLAELFAGDPILVAAAYNAGEGAVLKHGRKVPPYRETQTYVPLVLAARGELAACRPN
jgi:soluble lytic murein transglycosylase-like protein